MQYCHAYLIAKELAPSDVGEFKKVLYQMWFYFYAREVRGDTCGFEHVFVGEEDNGKITGLHNWIQVGNVGTVAAVTENSKVPVPLMCHAITIPGYFSAVCTETIQKPYACEVDALVLHIPVHREAY